MAQTKSSRPPKQYSGDQKASYVAAFRESGMNVIPFCRAHDIKETTFRKWLVKDSEQSGLPGSVIPGASSFIRLDSAVTSRSVSGHGPCSGAEIVYPDGRRLILLQPVSAVFLKTLIG